MKSESTYHNVAGFRCLELVERQVKDLCLTRCGIQQCRSTHSWGPKSRPQYHMHFILEGKGYLEIENQTYHLKRGQIFLIPPNIISHYYADLSDPWHYAFVSFVGSQAEKYIHQAGFSENIFVRDCYLPPEQYSKFIHEMLEAHQLTIANELKRTGLLFCLLSLLTDTFQTSNASTQYEHPGSTYLEHAIQFIQFNYKRNIQVNDIANYIGITRSYLFSIFKKNLNTSPKEYLLHYRMNKAMTLLKTTSFPISDISEYVGYENPLTFSKMFRNIVGVSPSHYRRKFLNNHEKEDSVLPSLKSSSTKNIILPPKENTPPRVLIFLSYLYLCHHLVINSSLFYCTLNIIIY